MGIDEILNKLHKIGSKSESDTVREKKYQDFFNKNNILFLLRKDFYCNFLFIVNKIDYIISNHDVSFNTHSKTYYHIDYLPDYQSKCLIKIINEK